MNVELKEIGADQPDLYADLPENPGWRPLLWLVVAIGLLIGLGEFIFVFGLELLEFFGESIFLLVEGSEEFLEDIVEEKFDLEPWEAEMYTAWATSPIKLIAALLLLRALWRWKKRHVFPAVRRWFKRKWMLVKRSWWGLWWVWKVLLVLLASAFLMILI